MISLGPPGTSANAAGNLGLISVILPVFNGEKYIRAAIDSVLEQDYRPLELLIVDDGSADRTAEIARRYVTGGIASYHFQDHQSLGAARNVGIQLARGEVIAFIDADDLYLPGKLSKQLALMQSDPGIEIVQARARQFISPELGAAERRGLRIMQEEAISQLPNSSLFRRSVFDRVGPFDATLNVATDMDWMMRALDAATRVAILDELVYLRRIHTTNWGRVSFADANRQRLHVLKAGLDRRRLATAVSHPQRISVVIPAYVAPGYLDCERFLRQALESVLSQDPKPFEIIVAYGPAEEGLESLKREYRGLVKFIHEPKPGDTAARNLGLRVSSGELIAGLDSDDYWARDKLRLQLAAVELNPTLEAVFTHAQEFYEPTAAGEPGRLGDVLPAHIPASMLIKRQAFLRIGYYDERYTVGGAVDWYVRAQEKGLRLVTLPDVLLFRRLHGHNQGRRLLARQSEYLHVLKASLDRRRAES